MGESIPGECRTNHVQLVAFKLSLQSSLPTHKSELSLKKKRLPKKIFADHNHSHLMALHLGKISTKQMLVVCIHINDCCVHNGYGGYGMGTTVYKSAQELQPSSQLCGKEHDIESHHGNEL